jgi:cell division protein FtsI/penicillin-binding protein 2
MRRHVTPAVIATLCLAMGLPACTGEAGPEPVLRAFLEGWPKGKLDEVGFVSATGTPISASDVVAQIKTLSGDLSKQPPRLATSGKPRVAKDDATAAVVVDWTVDDGVTWHYRTTVRMNRKNDAWRVIWAPETVHPDLLAGDTLAARRVPAERGAILDGAGEAIVKARPVVVVGVEPRRITNQAVLIAELDSAFKSVGVAVGLDDLPGRIASAKPDAFVEIVTLRREVYDRIRGRIHDLPGTMFPEETLPLAPTRTFARALLGGVDDVRKDQMDAHPGKYRIGDQVGQSGLQQRYDDALRGISGVRVVITGRSAGADGAPAPEKELFRSDPKAGQALRTTLDQRVQNAADAALAGRKNRAALVAVRVSDGAILAVANGPDGGELNLAFTAAVPPGSTFKMVTALGLLDAKAVGLNTPVNCPRTYSVEGRSFKNSNDFALGTVPFRVDFAKSCNTAFASLAPKLGSDGLQKAAASVGIGSAWNPGIEVYTGTVAANASPVEAAAAAFGQGTTQVSPVALAGAAAAVARGSWQQPKLFAQAPPSGPAPTVAPSVGVVTPAGAALNPASVAGLRTMLREVVTAGTGTALADVPGPPVHAKTGTAEFDNNRANTHAWTIGWQGDIAFAVFVEKGGSSTATAVPIVERFLRGLN